MQWFAQAPSNIALIKYMGKEEGGSNIPANPSLSYTLNHLFTNVALEQQAGKEDFWEPLSIPGGLDFNLSTAAQDRFLKHLSFLKEYFRYSGSFVVRSNNNFPLGCGLASSASSFAALTKCAVLALSELTGQPLPSIEEQAKLSRVGSGSSCRSFFSPWALWQGEEVGEIEIPYPELNHQVILITHEEKKVSSSEAHLRIKTSKLFANRIQRAEDNLKVLLNAFSSKDWESIYHICWREFQDIHHLFSTSQPPFSYMTNQTQDVLKNLQKLWEKEGDGPLVTMDAGPNIHLLYRPDQNEMALKFKQDYLIGNYDVL